MLKTKSVYSPKSKKDGLRILATRYRGRYMPRNRYDVWMPNLAPSEKLLKSFRTWSEFKKKYKAELFADAAIDRHNPTIKNHGQKFTLRLIKQLAKKGNVTLMCHCAESIQQCHRHVLAGIIRSKKL